MSVKVSKERGRVRVLVSTHPNDPLSCRFPAHNNFCNTMVKNIKLSFYRESKKYTLKKLKPKTRKHLLFFLSTGNLPNQKKARFITGKTL